MFISLLSTMIPRFSIFSIIFNQCRNNRKKNEEKNLSLKKLTSSSYEFLLHSVKKCTSLANEFLYMHADRRTDIRTYIYPPLDKRYSPIISMILFGPNNDRNLV